MRPKLQILANHLPLVAYYLLLVYTPFHVFLSQWLSTFTGGLAVWKVAKDVLTLLLVIAAIGAVLYFKKSTWFYRKILALSLVYFALHVGLYFWYQKQPFGVSALATVYNLRPLWYLLIGMSLVILIPKKLNLPKITRIVLIVSTTVAFLGVVQYFLPKDLLSNFGYSLERGARPAFFIDDKADLPRIMSTLRDPNSLGAFLIVPICLIVSRLLNKSKNKMQLTGMLGLHGLALLLTFSRSAWLGTLVAVAFLLGHNYKEQSLKFIKKYYLLLATCFLLLVGFAYIARDQYFIQNVITHSDEATREASPNEKRLLFAQKGLEGIAQNPLGHGPGTAGLVSIHNPNGGLLTENYYLQIGYEVGMIGLVIFVLIQAFVYRSLSTKNYQLSTVLLASFWGLFICSLLLHTWSNEAVAAQWWLLAGLSISRPK